MNSRATQSKFLCPRMSHYASHYHYGWSQPVNCINLHKHRAPRRTAEWTYCMFPILWRSWKISNQVLKDIEPGITASLVKLYWKFVNNANISTVTVTTTGILSLNTKIYGPRSGYRFCRPLINQLEYRILKSTVTHKGKTQIYLQWNTTKFSRTLQPFVEHNKISKDATQIPKTQLQFPKHKGRRIFTQRKTDFHTKEDGFSHKGRKH